MVGAASTPIDAMPALAQGHAAAPLAAAEVEGQPAGRGQQLEEAPASSRRRCHASCPGVRTQRAQASASRSQRSWSGSATA